MNDVDIRKRLGIAAAEETIDKTCGLAKIEKTKEGIGIEIHANAPLLAYLLGYLIAHASEHAGPFFSSDGKNNRTTLDATFAAGAVRAVYSKEEGGDFDSILRKGIGIAEKFLGRELLIDLSDEPYSPAAFENEIRRLRAENEGLKYALDQLQKKEDAV